MEWPRIFKVLEEKTCQPRNIYPEINTFRNKEEKKMFSAKGKLKKNSLPPELLQENSLRKIFRQRGNDSTKKLRMSVMKRKTEMGNMWVNK